jgi:hypothetical protein
MPKLNARENTRNRSQAKKRERNRLLRTNAQAPASPAQSGGKTTKPATQSSAKAKQSSGAGSEAK